MAAMVFPTYGEGIRSSREQHSGRIITNWGVHSMQRDWLSSAAKRYDECNRATLEFILSRAPLKGAFVDTKVHSITGENYDGACGIRGPEFTFGWIQGRALEALMTFARFYHDRDPDLSRRLP
mgnify:CR=1 FL=1